MFASNGINPQMMNYVPNTSGFGQNSGAGISSIFNSLFGHPGDPYKDAMKQYQEWASKAQDINNPFIRAGRHAIPRFNEWLQSMKDPSGFINNLMGNYQESPYAKYQQEQALRAAGNMGSRGDMASGGLGSTPMAQFEQQNARDISSQDMNQWLQNVLGINTQYGAGQQSLINTGQGAANTMTGFYGDMGRQMAEQAYNRRRAQEMQRAGLWGGIFDVAKNGLFG